MMRIWFLHIPKTGGTAVCAALRENVRQLGHAVTLEEAPRPTMAIVRDPVDRYLACWDVSSNQRKTFAHELERWPSADATALDDEAFAWFGEAFPYMFEPMTRWLRDAAYASAQCLVIAHTETLDDEWPRIREQLHLGSRELARPGHPSRNDRELNGVGRSTLSDAGRAAIRERYADDYALLAGLEGGAYA